MFHPLDIFKTDPDGGVLWRGSAETSGAAKALITKLAVSSPGEYLIFDQITGDKVRVVMGATTATGAGALPHGNAVMRGRNFSRKRQERE